MKLEFLKWFEELGFLKNLSVSRYIHPASSDQHVISVHTFCDVSQFANAAAVFVRIECADAVQVNILAFKSKVSPVKTINIPRLELWNATVGARLCRSVLSALQWNIVKQHYWTDSTTVLGWIQRKKLWTVFINNRLQEIRKLADQTLWKHLPVTQNSADLPLRECSPHQLICSRWWEGPKWLLQTQGNRPFTKPVFVEQSDLKERQLSHV
ncbi:hypothetical protein AVEN_241321-1 [Araneus ventricosus]|uniref:Uncharacterized protein n=1 Tax=Araneus ventricosus TaxID=182803 RepID=A0A4Y2EFM5_ARAVE|nr:hypothetical protein AVEN_241321-1 [Araneus ventricosus]